MSRQKVKAKTHPDFILVNHGSISVLTPLSAAGEEWIAEYIPNDAMTWGRGIVIEHRYVKDIVDGIRNDGLDFAG